MFFFVFYSIDCVLWVAARVMLCSYNHQGDVIWWVFWVFVCMFFKHVTIQLYGVMAGCQGVSVQLILCSEWLPGCCNSGAKALLVLLGMLL